MKYCQVSEKCAKTNIQLHLNEKWSNESLRLREQDWRKIAADRGVPRDSGLRRVAVFVSIVSIEISYGGRSELTISVWKLARLVDDQCNQMKRVAGRPPIIRGSTVQSSRPGRDVRCLILGCWVAVCDIFGNPIKNLFAISSN